MKKLLFGFLMVFGLNAFADCECVMKCDPCVSCECKHFVDGALYTEDQVSCLPDAEVIEVPACPPPVIVVPACPAPAPKPCGCASNR